MYSLLIRLMVIAALIELGISITDFQKCSGRKCLGQIEKASRAVLEIDWKPVSVFPEEAKRFR